MWRVDDCCTHGYVFYYRITRLDMLIFSLRIRMSLFDHGLGPFLSSILTFPCLWAISFSGQMILESLIGYWAWRGSSNDHFLILTYAVLKFGGS